MNILKIPVNHLDEIIQALLYIHTAVAFVLHRA